MIARGTLHVVFVPMLVGIALSGAGIILSLYILYILGCLSVLVSAFLIVFFRDPPRSIGPGVVSPADGRVTAVDTENNSVSIFMNVHNVHVNRAPLGGLVMSVRHYPGSHIPAFGKDSERNERVVTTLRTALGDVRIVQIAGIVARRIVPYIRPGMRLKKGQRIGIIRLGSRVDVHLPRSVEIVVEENRKVYAGVTRIGVPRHEMD